MGALYANLPTRRSMSNYLMEGLNSAGVMAIVRCVYLGELESPHFTCELLLGVQLNKTRDRLITSISHVSKPSGHYSMERG
jgi:hypothetical protein